MPGNQAVVQGVAGGLLNKPNGIGYASIAYDTEEVRPLQVAKDDQAPIIDPNYYNLQKGAYPLQRAMYVYINKRPGKAPEEVVLQFLRYTLSRNGQLLLAKGGFVPLHADEVDRQLRKVTPPEQPMQHKSLDSDL
jgi:phosphate transport system substrate-binding protein